MAIINNNPNTASPNTRWDLSGNKADGKPSRTTPGWENMPDSSTLIWSDKPDEGPFIYNRASDTWKEM